MITIDFSRIPMDPGSRILDIGCGSGRHTCEAYRCRDAFVVGADLAFDDVIEARGRLQFHDQLGEHGGGAWQLNIADIRHLPYKRHIFDLVICSEVMEHIPDEKQALLELARILKPEKYLALSVPRYVPERICWMLSHEYHRANQGHIRIYRKKGSSSGWNPSGLDTGGPILPTASIAPTGGSNAAWAPPGTTIPWSELTIGF